jgi:hypothetical protein
MTRKKNPLYLLSTDASFANISHFWLVAVRAACIDQRKKNPLHPLPKLPSNISSLHLLLHETLKASGVHKRHECGLHVDMCLDGFLSIRIKSPIRGTAPNLRRLLIQ